MNYSEQQKKAYNELKKRLVAYMSSVQSIYDNISAQAADIVLKTEYDPESNEVFSFSDYPEQRTAIQKMQNDFVTDLSNLIDRGVTKEWQMGNEAQNLLINSMVESAGVRLNNFYQKKFWQYNDEALNAFKRRKDKGMGLSTKIWQQSSELKTQLEDTISVAIQRGMSAITLSKRISQYLQNYPKLKQDYGEKFGTAIRCRDCEYKSIRLARTEINMSYRMAEQERWRNLDFVLGYRIKLSKNHTCKGVINFYDICDELEGDYPKDFVWAGWHPSCRCYAIPILMSEDEFERYNRREETTEKPITEMPKQFDEWLAYNADRIEKAQERGTLPYFLKDNKDLIYFIKNKDLISSSNLSTLLHDASIFGVDASPLYRELNRKEATEYSVREISNELWDKIQKAPLRITYDDAYSRYNEAVAEFIPNERVKIIDYSFSKLKSIDDVRERISYFNSHSIAYKKALKRHKQRTPQEIADIKKRWDDRRGVNLGSLREVIVKAQKEKIRYKEVFDLKKNLSTDDIIKKIGSADTTGGSCSSQALAYIANKCGFNVKDYRGGESRIFFANPINIDDISSSIGGISISGSDDFKNATNLLLHVKEGKEYYFACAEHAAIVRKHNGILEYLELQDKDNGFKPLHMGVLKTRFHAENNRKGIFNLAQLIDIDLFKNDEGLKVLLGYLNTR